MNKEEKCPYFNNGICLAQGQYDFNVICGVSYKNENGEICKFARNPQFDRLTELQNVVLWILKELEKRDEDVLVDEYRIQTYTTPIKEIKKQIKELKQKMRYIRGENE
ncbi:MAG: hypothetical protein ACTSUK_05650 [Promethearchaeota archaeon]